MSLTPDSPKESKERKKAFAKLFRKHREAAGLTQRLLAERLGYERKTVMRWENPKNDAFPKRETIIEMARQEIIKATARDTLLTTIGYLPVDSRENDGKLDDLAEDVTGDKRVAPTRIPQRREQGLLGREKDLNWLKERLTKPGGTAGVRGIGGIGKTALAVEAAWALRSHFPGGVIWLACGPHSVSAIQEILAGHLGAALEGDNEQLRANQLHRLLAAYPQALVVLDDMREAHQKARTLLFPPPPHALLVTSRREDVLPIAAQHRVDELDDDAARALLAQQMGDELLATAEEDVVQAILWLLENIPLALILAGRWVQRKMQRRRPPTDPLGLLHRALTRQRALLLDQHADDKTLSLRVTFNISYEELDEAAQWRVRQLGIFARNRFDLVGLAAVWQLAEEAARHAAIQQLETVGLLQEYDQGVYWMHDVLRDYAGHYLAMHDEKVQAAQQHARYCERILTALELRGLDSWKWLYDFLPEATQAGTWLQQHALDEPALAADLAVEFGNKLYSVGELPLVDWLQKGIEAAAAAEAERHKAILQTKLADLLKNRGQPEEAERLYRASLAVKESIGDSRGVAVTQSSLADLLTTRGQPEEAERLYRASLAVKESIGDSRGVAVTQSSLAALLTTRGQPEEAERLYRASLAVFESIGDSREVAVTQSSLADLLTTRGQPEEAERLYRASLAVKESIGDSRGVAVTQSSLADLLTTRGQPEEAERLYRASLAVKESIGDSRGVAVTQSSLADLLTTRGQPEEAERLYRASLAVKESIGDSRGVAVTQSSLADLLTTRGQPEEAERLYRASLAVKESIGDSRGVAVTQSSLADLLTTRGQPEEAERLYRASLAVAESIGDSRGVAVTQSSLADLLTTRGQPEEAERLYRASLAVAESIGDSRGVAVTQSSLADLLTTRGQPEEAERLYRASLAVAESIGDSRGVAVTHVGLADLLVAKGEMQAAADLYQSSLALFQKINDLMSVGATLTRLAQLALRVQQPADAVPLLEQAQALFQQLKATGWLSAVEDLLNTARSQAGGE